MSLVASLIGLAIATFVALVILLSIPFTREWVGLGSVVPTGIPGYFA